MGVYKFAYQTKEKSARAQVMDLNVSYKDLVNICNAIKGKEVAQAQKILADALTMKKAIPYTKFNTGLGHRSDLGGKKGRYPQKETKVMQKLLGSAIANATAQGMDANKLFIINVQANKQNTFARYRRFFASSAVLGYGKHAYRADMLTAKAEITLVEREPKAKKQKAKKGGASKAPAAPAAKPAAAKPAQEKKVENVQAQPQKVEQKPAEVTAEPAQQEKAVTQ